MRGHVRKRGKRWSIVIDVGKNEAGERVQRWHSGCRTKPEAQAAPAASLPRMGKGTYVSPSKQTLRRFLEDWLIAVKPSIRASTWASYKLNLEKHIVPALGPVPLQNLRPGMAEALGIGAEALTGENPRLVYASIHAFGKTGPLKDRPGYDPLMQAFGGLMSVTGHPGQPAVRTGTSIIDMGTGMWVAMAVITALLRRGETGRGGVVETSLYETALGWMAYFLPIWTYTGMVPGKAGSGTVMIAPYQAFPTKDGELIIAAGNDNLFRRLSVELGHPEWAEDPRFLTNGLRVENKPALVALMARETTAAATAEMAARLDAAGVPNAPVHTMDQVAAHPQTEAVGMLRGDLAGPLRFFGLPFSLDGERPRREEPAPPLGESDDWLDELLGSGS